jgi:hypothetical protein
MSTEKEGSISSLFNVFFSILMLPISLMTDFLESAGESLSGLLGAGSKAKSSIAERMRR